jgi:hypothetical protein
VSGSGVGHEQRPALVSGFFGDAGEKGFRQTPVAMIRQDTDPEATEVAIVVERRELVSGLGHYAAAMGASQPALELAEGHDVAVVPGVTLRRGDRVVGPELRQHHLAECVERLEVSARRAVGIEWLDVVIRAH